jgi:hypothetical protein
MPEWNYGTGGYYNPGDLYGADKNWWETPFVRRDLSTQPGMERGVYTRFLGENGFGGGTMKDQFARGQFGQMEDAFKAAMMTNPNLNRIDFYKQNFDHDAISRAYAALAPSQRNAFQPSQTRVIRFT